MDIPEELTNSDAYSRAGPRRIILLAADPLAALAGEILDLKVSHALPPPLPTNYSVAALRSEMISQAEATVSAARRLSVVFLTSAVERSGGSGGVLDGVSARSLAAGVAEGAALFTAASQALGATLEARVRLRPLRLYSGVRMLSDVRNASLHFLTVILEFVTKAQAAASLDTLSTGLVLARKGTIALNALGPAAGRVGAAAEDVVKKIPTNPAAAVRRALLNTALVLRRSAEDVRSETGTAVTLAGTTTSPPSLRGGPPAAYAAVDGAVNVLRMNALLIKAILALTDIAANSDAAEIDDSESSVSSVTNALSNVTLLRGGAGEEEEVVAKVGATIFSDSLAIDADDLRDAVIDVAAAASDAFELLGGNGGGGGGGIEEEEDEGDFEGEAGSALEALEELRSSTQTLNLIALRIRDTSMLLSARIGTIATQTAVVDIEASAQNAALAVTALLATITVDNELD